LRELRGLADVHTRLLSTSFEKSRTSKEVPDNRRRANIAPIFRKDQQDDLGNYRRDSLT